MTPARPDLSALPDAQAAALLFAVDPHGLGGILVRGPAGMLRDAFLANVRSLLPPAAPWRRLAAGVVEERLDGGLDLAATLASGRPVRQPGLLAASDGGVLVVAMAERLPRAAAARLGAALDRGTNADGSAPARFGLLALDEGIDDEAVPFPLAERLAFRLTLTGDRASTSPAMQADDLVDARQRVRRVTADAGVWHAIAEAADAFGIDTLRPLLTTLRAARAATALAGRDAVSPADAAVAARLVLAPHATRLPVAPPMPDEVDAPQQKHDREGSDREGDRNAQGAADDTVRDAVRSALPPGLLLGLEAGGRMTRQAPGRAGALQTGRARGRPVGTRRGVPSGGARLNLIETLRAAAPWQALRRSSSPDRDGRLAIRRDDLRLTRLKTRSETVTLFAVDASGSLALQRLAEAKGAVELLLAECYIRRDQVALLAFRGVRAELLLPPTRSLARAKRCLADLAGGGPTPLATALVAATSLADGIRRQGRTPTLVLFTDGRANVTRGGFIDRAQAQRDAEDAARAAAGAGFRSLLIDAAPRPQAAARALACAMNATYLPLPRADAADLTRAIRQAVD